MKNIININVVPQQPQVVVDQDQIPIEWTNYVFI